MAVSLLWLNDGSCSLEFEPSDIDRVSTVLSAQYGKPKIERYPTLTVYTFSNASLTFQSEWDDPCLIASSAEGIAMLETLARTLA
jgi:hypothetical protein